MMSLSARDAALAIIELAFGDPDTTEAGLQALHETVKLMCGYTTPVMVGKLTVMIPRSIAFSSMTEEEFTKFLEDGLRFIAETYGVTPESAEIAA